MARTISLREASKSLRELVALASRGEEVILAADEGPVAKLVPWPPARTQRKRVFGRYRGKIHIHDDFDAALPDDFWLGKDSQ